MTRYILLSFDVEEFDIPIEFKQSIDLSEQLRIGKLGLDAIQPILDKAPATLFTTANFADHFSDNIVELSKQHEIASHTYYHGHFEVSDLARSKNRLEEIIQQPVYGLRMPRMRKVDMPDVIEAGYTYDSSINPTWIPGKYNNRHLPRTLYIDKGMRRIPASVSPNLRIPLFWLSFKNFPYTFFKQLCVQTLKKDGYCCLYFHPWEFVDITGYGLPAYTRRHCGQSLITRLLQLMKDLNDYGEFITMNTFNSMRL